MKELTKQHIKIFKKYIQVDAKEENLEDLLKYHNNIPDNTDNTHFDEKTETECFYELIFNKSKFVKNIQILKKTIKKDKQFNKNHTIKCLIPRNCDILHNIFFKIKKNHFDYNILFSEIYLKMGGGPITSSTINYNLLESILKGTFIEDDEDYYFLPLLSFLDFKNSYATGFPIINIPYHEIKIEIKNKDFDILNLIYENDLILEYSYLDTNIRRKITSVNFTNLIFESNFITLNNKNIEFDYNSVDLSNLIISEFWSKAICITFIPKDPFVDTNFITFFKVILDGKEYIIDEIDNYNLFNHNISLISFSEEFNSFDLMKQTYKNPNNLTDEGINFPKFNNIHIYFETEENMELFDFVIQTININMTKSTYGIIGKLFN